MKNDDITRRNMLTRLGAIVAAATGLSVIEVESLLAQVEKFGTKQSSPKSVLSTKRVALAQKTANKNLKTLKVLIENTTQVFENEYGRVTPTVYKPAMNYFDKANLPRDIVDGNLGVCLQHMGISGQNVIDDLGICSTTNTCNGQKLTGPDDPCEGTNSCNGQNCTGMVSCDGNSCENQKCPKFTNCDKNTQKLVTMDLLNRFKNDPYVQALFTEFKVDNTASLLTKIQARLDNLASPN